MTRLNTPPHPDVQQMVERHILTSIKDGQSARRSAEDIAADAAQWVMRALSTRTPVSGEEEVKRIAKMAFLEGIGLGARVAGDDLPWATKEAAWKNSDARAALALAVSSSRHTQTLDPGSP